jgi:IS30 family transposase
MGDKYRQLTEQDRVFIDLMLSKHYPKAKIAIILKVHPSTIYREIKRNGVKFWWESDKYYVGSAAEEARLKRRKRGLKLEKDPDLRQYVHDKLSSGWSPYQIEGRLKRDNHGKCVISHESIYHYIYSDKKRQYLLTKNLRRKHQRRIKKGERKRRMPNELLIGSRPKLINSRDEFGHWECDLMMFQKGIKCNLITLRERKSRYLIAIKNDDKRAESTAMAIIRTINKIKEHVKSITFDQGSEFKKYDWIKNCIGADIYFCEPSSPYQKGAIENVNGIMRIEYPRSYDIASEKQLEISKKTQEINNRPMKCLSYQSPAEVFYQMTGYINENQFYES